MDFIRSCYTVDMQFDEAGQIVAPVQWYFCKPDAKLFHGPNAFCSSVWDYTKYSVTGLGEVWNSVAKYRNGSPPGPWPAGDGHVCGHHHWFHEGCPSDAPPLKRNENGVAWCCIKGGLLLGGKSRAPVYRGKGGIKLGGFGTRPALCQPWYITVPTTNRSLFRESTAEYWTAFAWAGNFFQWENPHLAAQKIEFGTSGSPTSCSGQFTSVGFLSYAPPNTGGVFLSFVSYNSSTRIGRWQVPLTALQLAGEYFDMYCPP